MFVHFLLENLIVNCMLNLKIMTISADWWFWRVTAAAPPGSSVLSVGRLEIYIMASVTFRDCFLFVSALITFVCVFVTGADFVRFVSFRAIYHNLSGAAPLCRGKRASNNTKSLIIKKLCINMNMLFLNPCAQKHTNELFLF